MANLAAKSIKDSLATERFRQVAKLKQQGAPCVSSDGCLLVAVIADSMAVTDDENFYII